MNICFVANFYKTYFFENIAKELEGKGYHIYWVCFDQKMYSYLLSTVDADNVLFLSKSVLDNKQAAISDFKLNELVNGDRFLRHQGEDGYNFLSSIQKPCYNFLLNNKIKFVFGEATHAHEVLIHRLTRRFPELECKYIQPQSVRIPSRRFCFMEDEFQSKLCTTEAGLNSQWKDEVEIIKAVKPRRVAQVDKTVKKELSTTGRIKRLKRFFTQENINLDSPSVVADRLKRTEIAIKEEKNKFEYKFVETDHISILEGKKFVLYTLHMQPEASVDVVGVYYDDQLQNIKNIWRILPDDWYIVIKEHSNAIGNRSKDFFKEFKKIRHSILLNEYSDSHSIIDQSQAIFTVSGTIAYEAALKGKPAFTFADIFFNKLVNCMKISLSTFRGIDNMESLLTEMEADNQNKLDVKEFSDYLFKNSFYGIVDAPLDSEDWTDTNNIIDVAKAFNEFMTKY
mgnify:CR=1 FL=1